MRLPRRRRACASLLGVAVDVLHNVYVGDAQNNRVLVYADPFALLAGADQANDFAAFAVFGQAGSFITNAANENGLSADSLNSPQGVALDASNNLFVADVNNNRALVFFSPIPMTQVQGVVGNFGDATADVAVGQPNLASGECNRGGSATLTSLCIAPFFGVGIAVDGADNLYVADTKNNRALEYNGPFGYGQTNNVGADLVFEGNNLAQPSGVAADSNGNFYVSSEQHNQVYEYTQPVALMTASLLNLMIGPGAQNPNAASLQFPMGLAVDAVNNLYVADQANNRVLEFNEGGSPGNKVANGAGGQPDVSHNAPNYVDAIGENSAGGIAVDASSDAPARHVYVADTINNRVLGWSDVSAYVSAEPAEIVFGQPDLFVVQVQQRNRRRRRRGPRRRQPVRAGADGGRCDGESVRGGLGQQSRARVQHSVQRRQRRAGRGRHVGGFRLRPGGRIHDAQQQSQRRQRDHAEQPVCRGARRRRQHLYSGCGEQSRARVCQGGKSAGGVRRDCESIVRAERRIGFFRHAMRRRRRPGRAAEQSCDVQSGRRRD